MENTEKVDFEEELKDLNLRLREELDKCVELRYSSDNFPTEFKKIPTKDEDIAYGVKKRIEVLNNEIKIKEMRKQEVKNSLEDEKIEKELEYEKSDHIACSLLVTLIVAIAAIVLLWSKNVFLNILLLISMPVLSFVLIMGYLTPFIISHFTGFTYFLYKVSERKDYKKAKEEKYEQYKKRVAYCEERLKNLKTLRKEYKDMQRKVYAYKFVGVSPDEIDKIKEKIDLKVVMEIRNLYGRDILESDDTI